MPWWPCPEPELVTRPGLTLPWPFRWPSSSLSRWMRSRVRQGPGLSSSLCSQMVWPEAEHPLKTWEWTIYQMPPFLWQEVAPSTVVLFCFFFSNSFWARGLEIAKGCELQDPGPLLHGCWERKRIQPFRRAL